MVEGEAERQDGGDGENDERDVVPRAPDERQQALHRPSPDPVRSERLATTTQAERVLLQTCRDARTHARTHAATVAVVRAVSK